MCVLTSRRRRTRVAERIALGVGRPGRQRISRDVQAFWKRNEKEERELRRKAEREEQDRRRMEVRSWALHKTFVGPRLTR